MAFFLRTDPRAFYPSSSVRVVQTPPPKKPIVVMLTNECRFVYELERHPTFLEHLDARPLFPKNFLTNVPPQEITEALDGAAWLIINPSHHSMCETTGAYASEKFAVDLILREGCKTQIAVLHTVQTCVDPPYMHNEDVWKRLKAVAHIGILEGEAFQAYPLAERFDLHAISGRQASWSNLNDRAEMYQNVPMNIGTFAEALVRLTA